MSLSSLMLGTYLIIVGCVGLFSLAAPPILLGILALLAGICVLLGDRVSWPSRA